MFEFGEDLLNGIEISAVWRKEEEFCSYLPNCPADRLVFVTAQIVHDDDISGSQCLNQELLDVGLKAFAIDRPIKDTGRVNSIMTKCRQERHCLPVTKWGVGSDSLTSRPPASERRHIGLGPGFINKNQVFGIKFGLMGLPSDPATGYVRAILFAGQNAFF